MDYSEELNRQLDSIKPEVVEKFSLNLPSLDDIDRWLARQNISADAKSVLSKIARTTAHIGQRLLKIGQMVFRSMIKIVEAAPATVFGLAVGALMSALVASVPIIGGLLGALLSPLLLAFGLGAGAMSDLRNKALEARILEQVGTFQNFTSGRA